MKSIVSQRSILTALSVLSLALVPTVAQARCSKPPPAEIERLKQLEVLRICQPLTVRIDSGLYEVPADLIVSALAPVGVAFRTSASNGHVIFQPTKDPKYKNYVVCNAFRRRYSEIPGLGKYVKHGLKSETANTLTYGWRLKRRSYHNVRFVTDVTVDFIESSKLDGATKAGVCASAPEIRNKLRWLQ